MVSRISEHDYQKALDWLFSQLPMFSRIGAAAYKPGLQTTERLDVLYGHPHRNFKAIHVAGTNGKGSTSHLLASVLQSQGYKTALYTSPHLTDFRERMRINGNMIPKEEVWRFVADWKERGAVTDLKPSFFELTMMMAFDWFAREKVDIAVIEVGMGGRLDSTNIISPLLSVITNISYDHTQFLGSTLEAIAGEKAGIIKRNIPVVIGEAEREIRSVFERKARDEGSPIFFAEEMAANSGLTFRSTSEGWIVSRYPIGGNEFLVPLAGEYQKKNITTVMCALYVLKESGIDISKSSVRDGLENVCRQTGLRGRWQIVADKPVVVCDTGHNVAGITETMQSLRERYPGRKIKFVVGFVNDKDVSNIVGLFPDDGEYFFTQADIPRAMDAHEVASHFAKRGIKGCVFSPADIKCNCVRMAFEAAMDSSSPSDVIYVGGSTFIVADFLKYYKE